MEVCTRCRSRSILTDYRIIVVTKHNRTKSVYCKDCLTSYINTKGKYKTSKYLPKLTQTKMQKYLEVIHDSRFTPIAQRMVIHEQTGEIVIRNIPTNDRMFGLHGS